MEEYKIGYSFNKNTGEFISEEIVYLETATGDYPHADNVVFIEPPTVDEYHKQVWNGSDWNVLNDYRGCKCWNTKGEFIGIITELGIDDTSLIFKEPPEIDVHFYKLRWDGSDWNVILKEGFILDESNNPREMTQVEKIQAGLEKIPDRMKIEDNKIIAKTIDELFDEGKLTVEEYNKEVDAERQARYQMETDKMGLMYLRGECTLDEWKSAMDKIREELPKK